MARPLTQDESEALTKSGILLRFAAENIKDFPQTIVSTINAAQDAKESNTWDQNIATEFWVAFNALCVLIKPVTIDTLSTNQKIIQPPKWKFWQKDAQPISRARQSAGRYLFLLMLLLSVTVVLSFLVTTTDRLNSEIQKLFETGNARAEQIMSELNSLEPTVGSKKFAEISADQHKPIDQLEKEFQELYYLVDQIAEKTKYMSRLATFGAAYDRLQ